MVSLAVTALKGFTDGMPESAGFQLQFTVMREDRNSEGSALRAHIVTEK